MTTAVRKRPRRLKVYQRITPEDGGLLYGLREIQQYMRLSISTIRKLRIKHGLPLGDFRKISYCAKVGMLR